MVDLTLCLWVCSCTPAMARTSTYPRSCQAGAAGGHSVLSAGGACLVVVRGSGCVDARARPRGVGAARSCLGALSLLPLLLKCLLPLSGWVSDSDERSEAG